MKNGMQHISWKIIIAPVALVLTTVASYYASLSYSFQFDDVANIKKMFDIRFNTLSKLFFAHPRWISQWLNAVYYSYVKFNPYLYRVGNVAFHTLGGVLVFYLLYVLLSGLRQNNFFKQNSFAIALTAAGLFLLHPVQTQTVSYVIQGQLEGLAGLTTIAMVLCFVLWVRAQSYVGQWAAGISMFCLSALSVGTKEITIISPLLVLLTDWFFLAQGNWTDIKKRWKKHALVCGTVWGLYFYYKLKFIVKVVTFRAQSRNNIGNQLTHDPKQKIYPFHFAISQFKVILHYLWMFVWPFKPFGISVEYDWMMVRSFFAPDCFGPLVVLLALWSYLVQLMRRNMTNVVVFAFAWFFIAIMPRSSIIPSSELVADYKTYLASVGVLLLLASAIVWLANWASERIKQYAPLPHSSSAALAMISLLLLLTGFATYQRNKVWRSPLEFWGNIIENAPGKARAYNNYAVALSEQKKFREAIPFYKKATQMDGNYPDPWNNLAVCYSTLGDLDGAITAMKKTIKIQPYYPEAYNNLASFLIQKKEFEKAEKMLKIALKLRGHYGKAYFNYGKLYLQQGKLKEAFPYFKKACTEADLDNEPGFKVYAQMAVKLQKWDDAQYAFSKLLECNPRSKSYALQLAQAQLMNKQFDKALVSFERLVQQDPGQAKCWFNAGEAAYQLSKYQKSMQYLLKAKEHGHTSANLYARLATCYDQLGQTEKVGESLALALKSPDISDKLKGQITAQLAALQNTELIS